MSAPVLLPARRRPVGVLTALGAVIVLLAAVSRLMPVPSSESVYLDVVRAVAAAPGWLRTAVDLAAEVGLLALGLFLLTVAWRARTSVAALVPALLAGGGSVLAYATSETLKLVLTQPRPCTGLGIALLTECPGPGDWSLPSNHATIAGALATAVVLLAPRWGWVAAATALVVASARVASGVHLPHDVVTGLVLGALVVAAVVLVLDRPAHAVLRAAARTWPARPTRP